MAIVFPRDDVIANIGVVSQSFDLNARNEMSRLENGVTISKRRGSQIWMAEWSSKDKFHDDAIDFEAIVHSLDDGLGEFYGYDTRRRRPKMHQDGSFVDTGQIGTIATGRNALGFKNLAPGQVLSRGDYFCFHYGNNVALHQLMEGATVQGTGITVNLEVRPLLRIGVAVDLAVKFVNPYGKFRLQGGQSSFATANILQSNAKISAYQVFE